MFAHQDFISVKKLYYIYICTDEKEEEEGKWSVSHFFFDPLTGSKKEHVSKPVINLSRLILTHRLQLNRKHASDLRTTT